MKAGQDASFIYLGIFLSGKGSNAEAIIRHFQQHPAIRVHTLFTNREDSGAFALGERYELPVFLFRDEALHDPKGELPAYLRDSGIDFIILAGFLRLIPSWLIAMYPNRMLNIHPALLPRYGGKGMYGKKVHRAVWENREKESGITIHLVNERYDEGQIIAQYTCAISPADSPEDLESKVRALELAHYPRVIEEFITSRV